MIGGKSKAGWRAKLCCDVPGWPGKHERWVGPRFPALFRPVSPDAADRLMNQGHQLTLLQLSWESEELQDPAYLSVVKRKRTSSIRWSPDWKRPEVGMKSTPWGDATMLHFRWINKVHGLPSLRIWGNRKETSCLTICISLCSFGNTSVIIPRSYYLKCFQRPPSRIFSIPLLESHPQCALL